MSVLPFLKSALGIPRGSLFEYGLGGSLLRLDFEFIPNSITRTRSVSVKTGGLPGTRGGYDFLTPSEAQRAAQGVTAEPESFNITILLDATDRMDAGDPITSVLGIQPELDVIRSMLEPKSMQPSGAKMLAALGVGNEKSFPQYQTLSVLLFNWGVHILPVFMTQAQIEAQEFLPTLIPYRAEVTLSLQVIESNNPFYIAENLRQTHSVMMGAMNKVITSFVPGR
ncbi:MAG: hypothetical protein FWD51_00075 [Betaproteobacteria bacterium]|nr:hypothetical protein [Betaproteobacteria bacterium]